MDAAETAHSNRRVLVRVMTDGERCVDRPITEYPDTRQHDAGWPAPWSRVGQESRVHRQASNGCRANTRMITCASYGELRTDTYGTNGQFPKRKMPGAIKWEIDEKGKCPLFSTAPCNSTHAPPAIIFHLPESRGLLPFRSQGQLPRPSAGTPKRRVPDCRDGRGP